MSHDALNFDSAGTLYNHGHILVYMSVVEYTCGAVRSIMTAAQQKSFVLVFYTLPLTARNI